MIFRITRASSGLLERHKPIEKAYKKKVDGTEQWCIDINSLEELTKFISEHAEYCGIIVESNEDIGTLPRITIYDNWIE